MAQSVLTCVHSLHQERVADAPFCCATLSCHCVVDVEKPESDCSREVRDSRFNPLEVLVKEDGCPATET
eukprot:m.106510 g.106510  ORF g.106510 m.106510 type:complete len:69 (+) comp12704_c0_seq6:367-573(+)